MHQRLKRLRFWASLRPGMPTIIMSGSFQRPGPANAPSFSLAKAMRRARAQSAFPGAQMSAVVRHMWPIAPAQIQG